MECGVSADADEACHGNLSRNEEIRLNRIAGLYSSRAVLSGPSCIPALLELPAEPSPLGGVTAFTAGLWSAQSVFFGGNTTGLGDVIL